MGEEDIPNNHSTTMENPSELPSVEDRMLFLGCLSCIVASSYDFEMTVEGSKESKEKEGSPTTATSPSRAPPEAQESALYEDEIGYDPIDCKDSEGKPTTIDQAEEEDVISSEDHHTMKNIARFLKIQEKMELAEQRHFVRRYKVAKHFILQSAGHLLLKEEEVSKELLPQLDSLLEDGSSSDKAMATSTKLQQVLQNPESNALTNSNSVNSLEWVQRNDDLQHYLYKLQPKPAYQCLCWLLFQHLLNSAEGYDARIRFWFKTLAVTLWVREYEIEIGSGVVDNSSVLTTNKSGLQLATKKWESLEECCADRLITLAAAEPAKNAKQTKNDGADGTQQRKSSLSSNLWKGLQVGSVGVGAGILLAVTGGLAAPGIAAGLAALGMGAVAGTFLSLASSAAVVSLFGVAGGSLAAYKMNRRVTGLTEFSIQQELVGNNRDGKVAQKPQLFRSIAISGWLHDKSDFQRPWGVTPSNPPIQDKVELLQRFYSLHNPQLIEDAEMILKKTNPNQLWKMLEHKYGQTPDDNIFANHPKEDALNEGEVQQLDQIIVAIGKVEGGEEATQQESVAQKGTAPAPDKKDKKKSNRFSMKGWGAKKDKEDDNNNDQKEDGNEDEKSKKREAKRSVSDPSTQIVSNFEIILEEDRRGSLLGMVEDTIAIADPNKPFEPPAHLKTVWNYPQLYGGELYSVKWESDLMVELSDSVKRLALEMTASVGQQVLKTTIASTLIIAAIVPTAIFSAMNSIDGTWTLVIERADEAGKELARSLLVNKGGHRPVTLMGYSFGGRIIYAALKELAQYQQKWEEHQMELRKNQGKAKKDDKKRNMVKVGDLEFDREPASIVEDAIIMGMPNYVSLSVWKACREVVSGRLVNVYSRKDKVLAYMFKLKQILGGYKPVVGTCTVAVPGVENIDVSDMVSSHEDYSSLIGKILHRVRLGQPVRSSSHAVDEEALLEEAKHMAEKQQAGKEAPQDYTPAETQTEDEKLLRSWE